MLLAQNALLENFLTQLNKRQTALVHLAQQENIRPQQELPCAQIARRTRILLQEVTKRSTVFAIRATRAQTEELVSYAQQVNTRILRGQQIAQTVQKEHTRIVLAGAYVLIAHLTPHLLWAVIPLKIVFVRKVIAVQIIDNCTACGRGNLKTRLEILTAQTALLVNSC